MITGESSDLIISYMDNEETKSTVEIEYDIQEGNLNIDRGVLVETTNKFNVDGGFVDVKKRNGVKVSCVLGSLVKNYNKLQKLQETTGKMMCTFEHSINLNGEYYLTSYSENLVNNQIITANVEFFSDDRLLTNSIWADLDINYEAINAEGGIGFYEASSIGKLLLSNYIPLENRDNYLLQGYLITGSTSIDNMNDRELFNLYNIIRQYGYVFNYNLLEIKYYYRILLNQLGISQDSDYYKNFIVNRDVLNRMI